MSCLYMWGVCTLPGGRKEKGKKREGFSGEAQERKAKEIVDLAYG